VGERQNTDMTETQYSDGLFIGFIAIIVMLRPEKQPTRIMFSDYGTIVRATGILAHQQRKGFICWYSAMKKVMAEINAQQLTTAQKTAIARSLGWSEKNILKYKPW
jgi:hypothetical protein